MNKIPFKPLYLPNLLGYIFRKIFNLLNKFGFNSSMLFTLSKLNLTITSKDNNIYKDSKFKEVKNFKNQLDETDIAIFTPMANEEKRKKICIKIYLTKNFLENLSIFNLDNASKDSTYEIVKKLEKNKNLKVIWCPNNKTVVDAYMEGYKNCYKTNYKWILEIDAGKSQTKGYY